jgi:6-phosphogluconolactonase
MQIEILADPLAVARHAASFVAEQARQAVVDRGRFVIAVSGGTTPWQMLRALVDEDVPWKQVHIVQVDERVAPEGSPDRNLTHIHECLLGKVPLEIEQIHPMPVDDVSLDVAARAYVQTLTEVAGPTRRLDLVHLGLGADGHTASLVPGDGALDVLDVDAASTGIYQGRRRMTLTYPIINRAARILWLVTGESKVEMTRRLQQADPTIPAGRVESSRATLFVDPAAGGQLVEDSP